MAKVTKKAPTYIRVSMNAKQSKFIEMSKRVQSGELEWVYYAIDGNTPYHYYLKLID